ncbi:MAG: hypothetical protein ABFC38_00280 [Methanospirillum sp.]
MTLRRTWLRRVDPWSAAKVAGALGALAGLVEGALLLAILLLWGGLIAATFPQSGLGGLAGPGAVVAGVLVLIFVPLTGAALGFVFGGVAAFLANLALGFAGGLELELEIE